MLKYGRENEGTELANLYIQLLIDNSIPLSEEIIGIIFRIFF
jgi:hypothetical protein